MTLDMHLFAHDNPDPFCSRRGMPSHRRGPNVLRILAQEALRRFARAGSRETRKGPVMGGEFTAGSAFFARVEQDHIQ